MRRPPECLLAMSLGSFRFLKEQLRDDFIIHEAAVDADRRLLTSDRCRLLHHVAPIALAFFHLCLGGPFAICGQRTADPHLFLELPLLIAAHVTAVAFVGFDYRPLACLTLRFRRFAFSLCRHIRESRDFGKVAGLNFPPGVAGFRSLKAPPDCFRRRGNYQPFWRKIIPSSMACRRDLAGMKLISDTGDAIRVLALGGEIDLHFAPVFRALLEEKREVKTEALVLDLSEISFIDSSGIAAIITHLRTATKDGIPFCIGGISEEVKEVFTVINLQKVMPVYETTEAALEAIHRGCLPGPREPLFSPAE
jgi:anti-sigma B factor antagonist